MPVAGDHAKLDAAPRLGRPVRLEPRLALPLGFTGLLGFCFVGVIADRSLKLGEHILDMATVPGGLCDPSLMRGNLQNFAESVDVLSFEEERIGRNGLGFHAAND